MNPPPASPITKIFGGTSTAGNNKVISEGKVTSYDYTGVKLGEVN